MNSRSFLSIFKATPLPMLVLSVDSPLFTISEVNAAFLKNNKCNENDIIGKSIFSVFTQNLNVDKDVISDLRKSLEKTMLSKLPDKMPVYKYEGNKSSEQEKGYFEFENIPVLSESGEIEYLIHTSTNVTKQEVAVRKLRSTRKKLSAAQQIAKIGYWKFDLLKNKLFWSEQVYNILGVKKEGSNLTNESFFQAIHPEDREMFHCQRSAVFEGGKNMNCECRVFRPDGIQKWILLIGKLIKTGTGETIAFEGTVQDITDSKMLQLSLKESNRRYYYASKATFDAVYEWDYINDTCYWGEGFIRDFGYDAETISDKDFWEKHVHPEDRDRIINEIDELAKGSASNSVNEYRFLKVDGTYAYVLDRSIIIRDNQGRAVRLIGAVQDITEKKNLQQLLDKANRLAKVGSWEIDVESGTVYWSDITKEIRETPLDYKPTLQDGISYFKEGNSKETIIARVNEAVKYGKPWQEDLQIYTHKGNLKWMRTTGKAEIVNSKCKKIYGSFQDIDESKKAELEILKLYEEKDIILESIGDGFCTVDENWIVTYWNKAAEKILLVSRDKILGQNLWDIFTDAIGSSAYNKYHESLKTSNRVDFEFYYATLDIWLEISVYPLANSLSIYFRDITERKISHLQLIESERRFSELFRLNPQPIWVFELDTFRFVQVNQAAIDLYGYSEEELLNMSAIDIRPAEEVPLFRKVIKDSSGKENYISGQFIHQTKAGKHIEVEVQSNFIMMNDKKYQLAIITDVTEKNRVDQQVTRAIIETQENERYEIGAELHDNVCQILASTHITLGVLSKCVNPCGMQLFHQGMEYISLAIQEIRNLSHRLAPSFFNDSAMEEAVEILLNNINVGKKYNISLYFDEALKKIHLARNLQLNLYRILQEQLRNILKYAKCTDIEVDLVVKNNKIKMRIADNGVGFDVNAAKGGIGLSNIRRRVELFSGKLDIFSSPGNGCELEIDIPLKTENLREVKKAGQLTQ